MRIFMSLITISCLIKTNSIFFQAAGRPVFSVISSTLRDMICFVPLMFILPAIDPSVELLLFAAPLADLLAGLVTAGLCISFLRSLRAAAKAEHGK